MSEPILAELRLENFRCFASTRFEPAAHVNLLTGENASGKTSLLEAIYLLGRGTSFRAARTEAAIRYDSESFTVFGRLFDPEPHRLGIEVGRGTGTVVRLDGAPAVRSDLARVFPVQVLDPSGLDIVAGAPAARRQFLDWGVFHVEHGFLASWQRYRRSLQQRNAALRTQAFAAAWAWDEQLLQSGLEVDRQRRTALDDLAGALEVMSGRLLDEAVEVDYQAGWAEGSDFPQSLERSRDRDIQLGTTSVGPHRADLRIRFRARRARESISRGQQKLIAAALLLAQAERVAAALERSIVLLIDEPAADLDSQHRERLASALWSAPAQCFMTSLAPGLFPLPADSRSFHVEHGTLRPLL